MIWKYGDKETTEHPGFAGHRLLGVDLPNFVAALEEANIFGGNPRGLTKARSAMGLVVADRTDNYGKSSVADGQVIWARLAHHTPPFVPRQAWELSSAEAKSAAARLVKRGEAARARRAIERSDRERADRAAARDPTSAPNGDSTTGCSIDAEMAGTGGTTTGGTTAGGEKRSASGGEEQAKQRGRPRTVPVADLPLETWASLKKPAEQLDRGESLREQRLARALIDRHTNKDGVLNLACANGKSYNMIHVPAREGEGRSSTWRAGKAISKTLQVTSQQAANPLMAQSAALASAARRDQLPFEAAARVIKLSSQQMTVQQTRELISEGHLNWAQLKAIRRHMIDTLGINPMASERRTRKAMAEHRQARRGAGTGELCVVLVSRVPPIKILISALPPDSRPGRVRVRLHDAHRQQEERKADRHRAGGLTHRAHGVRA